VRSCDAFSGKRVGGAGAPKYKPKVDNETTWILFPFYGPSLMWRGSPCEDNAGQGSLMLLSVWKGAIVLSLISIPVKLNVAARSERT
jgi:hypothetical protein